MLHNDTLCRLCKTNQQGPAIQAKMRPNYMCDSCYFNPKGNSLNTFIETKQIKLSSEGLTWQKSPIKLELVERE